MYLEHFGLGVNPFSLSPKLDFLYKSGTFEESMAHLVYGLDNHEAIVLITGAIGTGKTMALQSFLTNLGPRFEFALITNTRVTSNELLKLILEDLGVGLPVGADKSDLLILFKDFLHGASREGKMVLIVVDEAQNLAPAVLEEIRLLTNLGQGDIQPVQIILVGQPELDETVNRPDLAQIRQRIRVHYKLDPLTREETEEYLIHRMAVAGCSRQAFTSGAVDRIYQGSRGVPRLVNTLAGDALLSAFVAGHEMVQPGDIEENQDLRFDTGPPPEAVQASVAPQPPPPAPLPAPEPEPAFESEPEPEPEPSPRVQNTQTQVPQTPASPPLMAPPPPEMARRKSRNGTGRIVLAWALGALVVVVLGFLYFMGTLDGLVEAIYPNANQEMARNPDQETAAAVHQPQVIEDQQTETDLEIPKATDVGGGEVEQTDIQVNTPVESPEKEPAETAAPIQVVTPAGDGKFYVHIYSFRTPERAVSYVRHWDKPRYDITTRTQEIRGVTWHRIYVGPFATRDEALMTALRLQQDGTISYYKVSSLSPGQGS
ncbi:MAG: hypothetical protein DRR04_09330 [Gammaproteobacteria bacterium]|nr:MAG: hypothetical protein DRR04_09330 [Gammaproteobacteria bacterium]